MGTANTMLTFGESKIFAKNLEGWELKAALHAGFP